MLEGSWCILLEIITPCGLARFLPFSPPRLLLCVFPILSTITTTTTTTVSPPTTLPTSLKHSLLHGPRSLPVLAVVCYPLHRLCFCSFSRSVLSFSPFLTERQLCVLCVSPTYSGFFGLLFVGSLLAGDTQGNLVFTHVYFRRRWLVALIWLRGWPAWTTWHSLTH